MANSKHIYYYPAIFKESEDGYRVSFIDFNTGAFGNNLVEAMEVAQKTLESLIFNIMGVPTLADLPKPTLDFKNVKLNENEIILLCRIDIMDYLNKYNSKSIRKTLTIPCWLNILAEEKNLNFSQILQEALKKKLGID